MIRRAASMIALAWALGFIWFAVALPRPMAAGRTDGVIVLTGGAGRIDRGLEILRKGEAPRMLVSGVDREVKPKEFAAQYKVESALMRCCVRLGFDSVDTRSNAQESARWIAENKITSIRLVTTDWHMRRARHDLELQVPERVTILPDAVRSQPSLKTLVLEYHKLLARYVAELWGE